MLYGEYRLEDEIAVVKREAREDGIQIGMEKGMENRDQYVLDLINQGLTSEEIKQRV